MAFVGAVSFLPMRMKSLTVSEESAKDVKLENPDQMHGSYATPQTGRIRENRNAFTQPLKECACNAIRGDSCNLIREASKGTFKSSESCVQHLGQKPRKANIIYGASNPNLRGLQAVITLPRIPATR